MGNCKNPMKNKWFLVCFRREKSLRTNAESERNIFLHQKTSIPLPNDQKNTDPCPDDVNDGRKSPRRRRFRRVFERIISNAPSPLSKKKRNNKGSGKEACNNNNKVSSKFQKIFNTSSKKKSKSLLSAAESFSILSSHSSMFSPLTWDSSPLRSSLNSCYSSSSSFSPIFTTSRTSSRNKQTAPCMDKNSSSIPKLEKEEREEEKDGNCSSPKGGIGLYFMIVISLVGLIFWGEALAILCTSICLFLFSFINGGVCLKENGENHSSIDIEYKRKVVMEGIPERRNSYIPWQSYHI